MESANVVSRYFTEYVRRGFRNIFAEQRAISARKIYDHEATTTKGYPRSRSHELERALQSPQFDIRSSGNGITASASYPSYIRFLDMKRLGNYRIYNRPVWGILYKETLRDIRYEFSDWLRRNFSEEIRKSFQ